MGRVRPRMKLTGRDESRIRRGKKKRAREIES